MTDLEADPFAVDPIQRDQWDRPLIIPLTKRKKPDLKAKRVGYTRVSTLADSIGGAGGLIKYSTRHLALGMGKREDLAALASQYGEMDSLSASDKRELDGIIDRCRDASLGLVKADWGTAVHAFTEPGNQGVVPDRMVPDVNAYLQAADAAGLKVIDTEQFVVNDEVTAAGTFDHRHLLTRDLTFVSKDGSVTVTVPSGEAVVTDKKTGTVHLDKVGIQLAAYAHGKTYNPDTGERADLEVSTEWGILAHIPKGEASAELILIDLEAGWEAAKIAAGALAYGKRKDLGYYLIQSPIEVAAAATIDTVASIDANFVPERLATVMPTDTLPATYSEAVDAALVKHNAPKRDIAAECAENERRIKEQRAIAAADKERFDAIEAKAKAAAQKAIDEGWTDGPAKVETPAPVDPAPVLAAVPFDDEADALANVIGILGAEPILTIEEEIARASSRDELATIYHAHTKEWTTEHTAALQARDRAIKAAA